MYFLLAGVVEKFHYLKMGLAIVLTFIGAKMLVEALHFVIPIWISLIFVALVLLTSVAASLIWAKNADFEIDVDLPEDFDSPFEDDEPQPNEQLSEVRVRERDGQLSPDETSVGSDSHKRELENIERR
jgi:tellurite resistance protein TerC